MKKILLFLAAGLFAFTLQSDDLKIKSGRVFKNFAIMGAAPNGILIFHENGKAVIPVKEFPDEYREKIAKYEKEIPAKRREAAKLKAISRCRQSSILTPPQCRFDCSAGCGLFAPVLPAGYNGCCNGCDWNTYKYCSQRRPCLMFWLQCVRIPWLHSSCSRIQRRTPSPEKHSAYHGRFLFDA